MTIYFDENLPPVFAEGFERIQQPLLMRLPIYTAVQIKSIPKEFGRGCLDPDLFMKLAKTESCCITWDRHMRSRPHERVLYEEAELGLFIIEGGKKGMKYWEIVELMVKRWPSIIEISLNQPRPFTCLIPRFGNKHYKLL